MKTSWLSTHAGAGETEPRHRSNRAIGGPVEIPDNMIPALRSDHAGETGAVEIYKGILTFARDDSVRAFARHHLVTENRHLELLEGILSPKHRTRLLPLCRWAGWITGALPALIGAPAVYRTIDAVESFVDGHYSEQILALGQDSVHQELRSLLERCRSDEIAHRDDARARAGRRGLIGSLWSHMVTLGSRLGVDLAKRF